MNLTAGVTLQNGKYVLNGILGESHLGITLKATQAYLNQPVVLKTLKLDAPGATDVVALKQQFVETTRQIAQCQHPGLVRILDLFEESGLPFMVMDFVAGQRLLELVQTRGPLPEAQALNYIRQVGSAVSVMHRYHLVHRDIQPRNLICPPGANFVVLVDCGTLSHPIADDADTPEKLSRHPYRAIEQYQPQATLSAATDVYALAATLYFLVTGKPPIAAPLREASPLVLPRQLQPQLSAAVESAILSGMQPHVRNRPQTIAGWFSLLPGGEMLPPVQGLASSNGATHAAVQLPQTPPSPSGHTAATPPVPPPTLQPGSWNESNGQSQRIVPPAAVTPVPVRKSRMPKAIAATIAIAAAFGMGIGLTLRFSAVTGIGPKIFNTQQTFPPRDDWGEAVQAPADSVAPPPPPSYTPPARPQSGSSRPPARIEADPPQPSPAVPQPSPETPIEMSPSPVPSPVDEPPLPAASPTPPPAVEAPPPVVPPPAPPASPEPVPPTKSPEGT